jgi:hypothetical protein
MARLAGVAVDDLMGPTRIVLALPWVASVLHCTSDRFWCAGKPGRREELSTQGSPMVTSTCMPLFTRGFWSEVSRTTALL